MSETMDIYAKKGAKVTVTEESIKNGYPPTKRYAEEHLEIGKIYTINQINVYPWDTHVILDELPYLAFNSVSFEDVPATPKNDIET